MIGLVTFFELIHECIDELGDEIKIVNVPLGSQFHFDIVFIDDNEAAFEYRKSSNIRL